MNSKQLLEAIGKIDDDLIIRAEKTETRKKKSRNTWYKIAIAASLICICGLLYKIPAVKASIDPILEALLLPTRNYDDKSLDEYKVDINQSQSLDGLKMTVNQVVLETDKLIVQCNFEHEDEELKNEDVMPREWPFCFKLADTDKVIYDTQDADDIMTTAYETKDGRTEVIFTIDLQDLKDVNGILNHAIDMTFYYNHGTNPGDGYTFHFTPSKVYEEQTYHINKTYEINPYGSFTVEKMTKEALYLNFQIDNKLKCQENENIDIRFVDENGTEYYQERNYDYKDYWFARPENMDQKFYFELVLNRFNKNGVGTGKVIEKFPVSW